MKVELCVQIPKSDDCDGNTILQSNVHSPISIIESESNSPVHIAEKTLQNGIVHLASESPHQAARKVNKNTSQKNRDNMQEKLTLATLRTTKPGSSMIPFMFQA